MCSKWLGSGISRDVNDLRRVQQLLVTSLDKLNKDNLQQLAEQPSVTFIYGEAVSTLESLAVLMAWADVSVKTHVLCNLYSIRMDFISYSYTLKLLRN